MTVCAEDVNHVTCYLQPWQPLVNSLSFRSVHCRVQKWVGSPVLFLFFVDLWGLCMHVNLVKLQPTVSRYPGCTVRLERPNRWLLILSSPCVSPAGLMCIEEYIEEDEEPPLLLGSCPPHGKQGASGVWENTVKLPASTDLWLSVRVCVCVRLQVVACGGTAAVQGGVWKDGLVCLQCPAGQEPTKVRSSDQMKWRKRKMTSFFIC